MKLYVRVDGEREGYTVIVSREATPADLEAAGWVRRDMRPMTPGESETYRAFTKAASTPVRAVPVARLEALEAVAVDAQSVLESLTAREDCAATRRLFVSLARLRALDATEPTP